MNEKEDEVVKQSADEALPEPGKGEPITIVKAVAWSSFPAELVAVDGTHIHYRLPGTKVVRTVPLGVATYRPRSTGSRDGL